MLSYSYFEYYQLFKVRNAFFSDRKIIFDSGTQGVITNQLFFFGHFFNSVFNIFLRFNPSAFKR